MREVLVTAGATRNPVDAVRYISANSSGRTGVKIAQLLEEQGSTVTLMGSVEATLRAPSLSTEVYTDTRDLMRRMERWVREHPNGAVIHAAAVGDYESPTTAPHKIPSGDDEITLRFVRTPKIADAIRGWGLLGPYVTFKAASPETTPEGLVAIAQRQRARVDCDLVFGNILGALETTATLVGEDTTRYNTRAAAIDQLVAYVVSALNQRA